MSFSVAIDGPAGAGKSTIAKSLAKKMNSIYVDTGAMYRAMALFLIQNGVLESDSEAISKKCEEADITIEFYKGEQIILLNGENVNQLIRSEEVGNMASVTSTNGKVRNKLVELQRKIAAGTNVIMDGRDIGTCVLPNAEVKIYLTADTFTRAERRYHELLAKGEACDLSKIEMDIKDRDFRDMTREHSPLVQADDAILLDSSHLNIEEVIEAIYQICQARIKA